MVIQKVCEALHYRQIVYISMDTYCVPIVTDLFLVCYRKDFMLSLSDNKQADVFEAYNSPQDI